MAILEKEVLVTLHPSNINIFEKLGYIIPKYIDKRNKYTVKRGTKILVKIEDVPHGSNVKVTKICDLCDNRTNQIYYNVLRKRNQNGKDYCKKCIIKIINEIDNIEIPYEKRLSTTHPEIAKLLKNKELGNKLTYGSGVIAEFICEKCNSSIKKIIKNAIKRGISCSNCSDGISYPEKFMTSVLKQLNIQYEYQKIFEWSNKKRYDFYIPSLNLIIETNGNQHYKETNRGRSLKQEQENDLIKQRLSKENKIKEYVIIDCMYSELEWIKNNLMISKLNKLFDLEKIDWMKCHEFACNSIVKIVCDIWESNNTNTGEISKKMNLSIPTVIKYLKQGSKLGWCNYDVKEESGNGIYNSGEILREKLSRKVIQLSLNGEYIKEWENITEAVKVCKSSPSNISKVCKGKRVSAGGYKWMYKEDYDQYIEENNLHILVN